jgi:hypothetical protein
MLLYPARQQSIVPRTFLWHIWLIAVIRDALKAARKQWGVHGVLSLRSPATPERIRIEVGDPILKRAAVEPREGEKSFFISI